MLYVFYVSYYVFIVEIKSGEATLPALMKSLQQQYYYVNQSLWSFRHSHYVVCIHLEMSIKNYYRW